jgi:hypothetical protein
MTRKILLPWLLGLAALGGCAESSSTVELTQLCFPPADCTFQATCTQIWMGGRLDVDLVSTGGTLYFPIQIENRRLKPTATGAVDVSSAVIEEYRLTYSSAGVTIPGTVSRQTNTVPSEGSTVAMVALIPPAQGAALIGLLPPTSTEVLVHVKAAGHFADGTSFVSREYQVPVDVSHVGGFGHVCVDTSTTPPTLTPPKSVCPQDGQSGTPNCT